MTLITQNECTHKNALSIPMIQKSSVLLIELDYTTLFICLSGTGGVLRALLRVSPTAEVTAETRVFTGAAVNRPHPGVEGTHRTRGTDRKSRRRRRRSIGTVTTAVTSGLVAFTTGLPEHRPDPTGTTGGPEGEARPTHTTGVNTGSLYLVYDRPFLSELMEAK